MDAHAPLLKNSDAPSPPLSPALLADNGDYVPLEGFKAAREVFWTESVKLWRIAMPIIFNILCQFGVNSFTNIFVGHLGDIELSAVSLSLSVIGTFSFGFMVSLLTGFSLFLKNQSPITYVALIQILYNTLFNLSTVYITLLVS